MPSGYTFDSNHGPGVSSGSSGSSSSGLSHSSGSSGSSGGISNIRDKVTQLAQNISNAVKTNTSTFGDKIREVLQNPATSAYQANLYDTYIMDYGNAFDTDEYYDKLMEMAGYNNDWSAEQAAINRSFQNQQATQAMNFERSMAQNAMNFEAQQAKKQMDFQWASDKNAMAWSAKEAAKSRDWTKSLSNTAHQREVKDLLAAGLNPILAANGGAWSGSGATGQGFSSSGAMGSGFTGSGYAGAGAMGQTDMSITGAFGSLIANSMTTARDLAITKMQMDQQKYNTDQQYAMAKMAAETSIYNNNSNIDANKAITALNRDADIRKAGISADATRAAAAMSAGAITSAASTQASATKYAAEQSANASRYKSDTDYLTQKYLHDNPSGNTTYEGTHNMTKNPIEYFGDTVSQWYVDKALQLNDLLGDLNKGKTNYDPISNSAGRKW